MTKTTRARYTLEFKQEAVRLVKGGQAVPVTAKLLGVPVQTLGNGIHLSEKGQPKGAGDKPVCHCRHFFSKKLGACRT
jgi:transposase